MYPPVCKHCRLPESAHHEFEPIEMPKGCVCDPETWLPSYPNPICDNFVKDEYGVCVNCEHDEACHAKRA